MFRRLARTGATASVLVGALLPAPAGGSAAAGRSNPRPQTIPALRAWQGGRGHLRLSPASRAVLAERLSSGTRAVNVACSAWAARACSSGVRAGALWLDVRYPSEYQYDKLPGAINVPLAEVRNMFAVLDRSRDYVAYCQSGRRSAAAAFLFAQRGFRVWLLDGGLKQAAERPS